VTNQEVIDTGGEYIVNVSSGFNGMYGRVTKSLPRD